MESRMILNSYLKELKISKFMEMKFHASFLQNSIVHGEISGFKYDKFQI